MLLRQELLADEFVRKVKVMSSYFNPHLLTTSP